MSFKMSPNPSTNLIWRCLLPVRISLILLVRRVEHDFIKFSLLSHVIFLINCLSQGKEGVCRPRRLPRDFSRWGHVQSSSREMDYQSLFRDTHTHTNIRNHIRNWPPLNAISFEKFITNTALDNFYFHLKVVN